MCETMLCSGPKTMVKSCLVGQGINSWCCRTQRRSLNHLLAVFIARLTHIKCVLSVKLIWGTTCPISNHCGSKGISGDKAMLWVGHIHLPSTASSERNANVQCEQNLSDSMWWTYQEILPQQQLNPFRYFLFSTRFPSLVLCNQSILSTLQPHLQHWKL